MIAFPKMSMYSFKSSRYFKECCLFVFIICSLNLTGHQTAAYPVSVLPSFQENMAAAANSDRESGRERRKTAGESIAMCKGTGEALGHNLNRRRLFHRQEMRGRLVPGMGLNWMVQTQTGIRRRLMWCS